MEDGKLERLANFVEQAQSELEEDEGYGEKEESIKNLLKEIENIIEDEKSHRDAGDQGARNQFSKGETLELMIDKPPEEGGPDAVAQEKGIVIFVSPQELDIRDGDTVKAELTSVGVNHANAVATNKVKSHYWRL